MRWDVLGRLTTLPWAALRLLRFPGVAVALVAAALVVAVSAVGGALYVDDAGDAALAQIAGDEPLLTLRARGTATDVRPEGTFDPNVETLWPLVPGDLDTTMISGAVRVVVPRVASPGVVAQTTEDVTFGPVGGPTEPARLLARDGFERHLQVVAAAPDAGGDGVWLSRSTADRLGVRPGDQVALSAGQGLAAGMRLPLAGVYADFDRAARLPAFWRPATALLQGRYGREAVHLEQPILCGPATLFQIAGTLGRQRGEAPDRVAGLKATIDYVYPPPPARRLAESAEQAVNVERLLRISRIYPQLANLSLASDLPAAVRRAHAVQSSLAPGVETVGLAGIALGVVLAGTAGAYAARRRRTELLLRYAQGRGAPELGGLLALEAVVPLVVGGALGWAGAAWLVGVAGPSGLGAPREALVAAGAGLRFALPPALAAVGLAGWFVTRRSLPEWTGVWEGRLAKPPWELLVLGVAAAALYEVLARGQPLFADPEQPPQVDRLLVLLPILLVAGLAGLVTRAIGRYLASPRARRSTFGVRRTPVGFLAMRRLTSATRSTLALATAATVAFGVLAYALTIAASVRALGTDKIRTWVGSDVAVAVPAWPDNGQRDRLARLGPYSAVERGADLRLGEDGTPVDLLAIDPDRFERAVYWDRSFASTPLTELLARLGGGRPDEIPALLVGAPPPAGATLRFDVEHSVPLRFVGDADLFPGLGTGGRALVVVEAERLHAVAVARKVPLGLDGEVWGKGTAPAVAAAIGEAQAGPPGLTKEAAATQRLPAVLAVRWTFQPLGVFGALAGLVALAGLLLYLQARATGRTVSYALARRMGLRRFPHMLATALEIAGLLLAPVALGSALAWASAWLVLPLLDPLPALPPGPVPRFPLGGLGLVLVGVVAGAWLAAWLIQRRLDRADVGEVLRLAA